MGRRNCDETQAKIKEFGGQSAQVLADLSLAESVDKVLSGALDAFGRVDILVNNAGIIKRCDAIDVPKQDWDSVINVNLNMVFLLCQAFAKQYVKQGDGGKIINVCSMLHFRVEYEFRHILQVRVRLWDLQKHSQMNGHQKEFR